MNIEAEQQVLGCLLTNNACIASIDFLRPEHFSEPAHQRTYDEACRRIQAGEDVTAVTLYRQMGEQVPEPGRYFAHLAAMAATVPSVASIAWEVVNHHHATKLVQACNEAVRLLDTESPQEVSALLDSAIRDVLADHSGRLTATDAAVTEEILEDLKTDLPAMKTGIQKLDDAMDGGMYSGKLYGVMARKKVGKAQPLNAKVLTLDGWKCMRDIQIGNDLATPDGLPSKVVGIYPQGKKEIMRVTFSDGRKVECCPDHLWEVEGYRGKGVEVIDTRELGRRSLLSLPTYIPWFHGEFGGGELPIAPYLLGAILGDGGISQRGITFSTIDDDILTSVSELLPEGVRVRHADRCNYRLSVKHGGFRINPLLDSLRELNLSGKRSEHKFIPDNYLNASSDDRWELLRGLMDTDGYVTKKGSICFDTSSPRLARDVRTLVRSLGGAAKIKRKRTTHLFSYKVKIRHAFPSEFFRLPRKKLRAIGKRKHQCRLSVKRVEFVRMDDAQCISVSHPRGLYITNEFTVTHNTVLASTISYNLAQEGVKHLFICGEMGPKEIQQRNLARELQVFPSAFRNSYGRSEDFMLRIAQYVTRSKRCIIYQNAPGLTFDKLRQYCVSAVYKHKVKGIILDYWQLVGGKASRASTAEHLDEVAQWLANFGRQHNVWMFVTAQENQDGNTRGGEGLRLACDQCYCLHRENLNEPGAWMEMIDTRYTRWTSIGDKDFPALYMHDKGPYFSQEVA